jgi:hypothetical protein
MEARAGPHGQLLDVLGFLQELWHGLRRDDKPFEELIPLPGKGQALVGRLLCPRGKRFDRVGRRYARLGQMATNGAPASCQCGRVPCVLGRKPLIATGFRNAKRTDTGGRLVRVCHLALRAN